MSQDDLSMFSSEELESELKRRDRRKQSFPQPLENPDYRPLETLCREYLEHYRDHDREMKDGTHWIYETALTCIYGTKVYDWINQYYE